MGHFNRTPRNKYWIFTVQIPDRSKEITENWLRQYNEERSHESLDDLTPAEFLMKNSPKETTTFGGN
ncbi:MAG: integrase core domain-containing protein [Desulfomicrobium sp.]|nr:integrase core domain-containing protein [Pseudomonadota bacterium]MBU4594994.1 integrase core domain-containing protein [Pseudomonadota bacterium]MBV1711224.1 integrase core domain-containing protein [Desulfomicrobium sp.]MBV1746878.1 integrase core domain-containing protein [Desulfomicrobium sp.]